MCSLSRAVHLKLLLDQKTEGFTSRLQRFTTRYDDFGYVLNNVSKTLVILTQHFGIQPTLQDVEVHSQMKEMVYFKYA